MPSLILTTSPKRNNSSEYPSVSPQPFVNSLLSTPEMVPSDSCAIPPSMVIANQDSTLGKKDCNFLPPINKPTADKPDKSNEVPRCPPESQSKLELLLANKENNPFSPINKKDVDSKVVLDRNEN